MSRGHTVNELDKVETKSNFSEKNLEILQEVEERLSSRKVVKKLGSIWKVSEAKFASTGILSKLGKAFDLVYAEDIEVTLPVDLVSNLSQKYEHLCFGVVVEKREWQTDCYYDYALSNTNPFLIKTPDQSQQEASKSAIKSVIIRDQEQRRSRIVFIGKGVVGGGFKGASPSLKHPQRERGKKVRMSMETKEKEDKREVTRSSLERPLTGRSIASNVSYKSDLSGDSCITTDYDRLPAELCPTILHYRRESTSLKINPKTLTRMEKIQAQRKKQEEVDKTKRAKRE